MSAMKQIYRSVRLAGLTFGVMALLPAATSSAASKPDQGLISTQGRGEVRVRPDSLRVEIGAEAQAKTLEKARTEVNRRIQRVLQAMNKLGISGLSLETQTIQLSPIHATPKRDEIPQIIGYRAENSITALLLDAAPEELGALASRIVDTSLKAGANTVSGIGFFVKNVREAQERALEEAIADAERRARRMAKAAGVRLGRLHSLDSSPSYQSGFANQRALEAVSAPTPVVTGETVITSNVSARYRLLSR